MTQEQLASALDLDPMTVSRFERGVTLPSLVTLQQIAGVFGTTMAQMLESKPAPATSHAVAVESLMRGFNEEERDFVLEMLRRYRRLRRRK